MFTTAATLSAPRSDSNPYPSFLRKQGLKKLKIMPKHIKPVPALHRRDALRLLLREQPDEFRENNVKHFSHLFENQSLQPDWLLGLYPDVDAESLEAVMLYQILPGNTAVVWVPTSPLEESTDQRHELFAEVMQRLEKNGVKFAQSAPDHLPVGFRDDLLNIGFFHLANLLYLVVLRDQFPFKTSEEFKTSRLRLVPFSPERELELQNIVEESYDGTLDCPEISGVLTTEEVLVGYRAQGDYRPERWFFATTEDASEPVGVLLMSFYTETNTAELTYMGICPSARGAGLGADIAELAIEVAASWNADQLVVAVDARNDPAVRAYQRSGFNGWMQREVYVKTIAPKSSATPPPCH